MIVLIFLIVLAIFLILSRRKLGLFSLAVFAGISINRFWNGEMTDFLVSLSLNIPKETLSGIVGLSLILILPFLVLAKGGKQENWLFGIISSIAVSIFVTVVSISNISAIFVFDELSKNLMKMAENYYSFIILAGAIFSVLGILSFKIKKPVEKS